MMPQKEAGVMANIYCVCPNCNAFVSPTNATGKCWHCDYEFPTISIWWSDRTEEPCPHCGKTRDEGGGE